MRQPNRLPLFVVALLAGAVMLTAALPAAAQDTTRQEFDDTVHVIQRKPVLQKGRLDFAPRFGVSINDSMYRHYKAGANANYHLTERFYLGGLFEWYDFDGAIGGTTAAFDETISQTGTTPDAPVINWLGGAELGLKPIVGKFALFGSSIIYYDVGVSAGGAYIDGQSVEQPADGGTFGGTVSANTRVFFNDWMALNIELRDVIFQADLVNQPGALSNVLTVSAGASFYLPTAFEYSE